MSRLQVQAPVVRTVQAFQMYISSLRFSQKYVHLWAHTNLQEELEVQSLVATFESQASKFLPPKSVNEGEYCLARAIDNKWYRAKVKTPPVPNSKEVIVFNIDYGHSSRVSLDNIRTNVLPYFTLPAQAKEFVLADIHPRDGYQWTEQEQNIVRAKLELCRFTALNLCLINARTPLVRLIGSDKQPIVAELLNFVGRPYTNLHFTMSQYTPLIAALGNKVMDDFVNIFVSYSLSPDKFWIQLAEWESKLDKLREDMHTFYSSLQIQELSMTEVEFGMLCAVQSSIDDCFYRAVIQERVSPHEFSAFFIDYGNSENRSLQHVKALEKQFKSLPAQACQCYLAGMPPGLKYPETVVAFFRELVNNKVLQAKIGGLTPEGSNLVCLVAEDGSNIKQNLDMMMASLRPSPEKQSTHSVSATNGPPPGYRSASAHAPNLYAEPFTPRQLAQPLSIQSTMKPPSGVPILSPNAQLRDMTSPLQSPTITAPTIPHPRTLTPMSGMQPTQPVMNSVNFHGKQMAAVVDGEMYSMSGRGLPAQYSPSPPKPPSTRSTTSSGDRHPARTPSPQVRVMPVQVNQQQTLPPAPDEPVYLDEPDVSLGEKLVVFITNVSSQSRFFGQLGKYAPEDMDNLATQLMGFYPSKGRPLSKFYIGCICAAYSRDGYWYRAQIQATKNMNATVFFLDYGDTEEKPLNSLRYLEKQFSKLPRQGILMRLAQPNLDLSDDNFSVLMVEKKFQVKLDAMDRNGVYDVTFTSDKMNKLVLPYFSNTMYEYTRVTVENGKKYAVSFPFIQDPGSFYVRLTSYNAKLDDLMDDMAAFYETGKSQHVRDPQIGMLVTAQYTQDDGWYRAVVTSVDGIKVTLRYLDYGNNETVMKSGGRIRVIKPEFTKLEAQALHCRLRKVESSTAWKDAEIEHFETLCTDPSFAEFHEPDEAGVWSVTIINGDGKNVNAEIDGKSRAVTPAPQSAASAAPTPTDLPHVSSQPQQTFTRILLKPRDVKEVTVSYTESPHAFYCQLKQYEDQLNQLMDELGVLYASQSPDLFNPSVGMICCAKYSEDNGWYRAEVTEVSGNTVTVYFVDYGNGEAMPLSRVKRLLPKFHSLPTQAIKCRMDSIRPRGGSEWSDIAIDAFAVLAEDGYVTLQVVSVEGDNVNVHLKKGQDDIGKLMIQGSHAVPETQAARDQQVQRQSSVITVPPEPRRSYQDHDNRIGSEAGDWDKNVGKMRAYGGQSDSDGRNTSGGGGSKRTDNVGPRFNRQESGTRGSSDFQRQDSHKSESSGGGFGARKEGGSFGGNRDRFPDKREGSSFGGNREGGGFGDRKEGGNFGVKNEGGTFGRKNDDAGGFGDRKESGRIGGSHEGGGFGAKGDFGGNRGGSGFGDRKGGGSFGGKREGGISDGNREGGGTSFGGSRESGSSGASFGGKREFRSGADGGSSGFNKREGGSFGGGNRREGGGFGNQVGGFHNKPSGSPKPPSGSRWDSESCPQKFPSSDFSVDKVIPVTVTWSNAANDFWCQSTQNMNSFTTMMGEMQEHYAKSVKKLESIVIGKPCAALFPEDCAWYRAEILESEVKVEVLFVDFGNSATVKSTDCRPLIERFIKLPPQAFHCRIEGVEAADSTWTTEAKTKYQGIMDRPNVKATIVNTGDICTVTMVTDGKDATELLIDGGVLRKSISEPVSYTIQNMELNSEHDVIVVQINSPADFFVHLADTEPLDKLMDDINKYCTAVTCKTKPKVGEPVLAVFSEDNGWYRAMVTEVTSPETVAVFYVDYGNTATVRVADTRAMPRNFTELPVQAMCCSLYHLKIRTIDIDKKFRELAEEQEAKITIKANNTDGLEVHLEISEDDIGAKLAAMAPEANIFKDRILETGKYSCIVSHAEMPDNFHIHLVDDLVKISEMSDTLHELKELEELKVLPAIGTACLALYSEDELWYRSTVTDVEDEVITVLYVDYGNGDDCDITALRKIPDELLEEPALAVRCGLSKLAFWEDAELDDFSAATDGPLLAEIKLSEPHLTRLFNLKGEEISRPFLSKVEKLPEQKVLVGKHHGYLSHANSVDDFYIHVNEEEEALHAIVETLEKEASSYPVVENPTIGLICATQFSEDGAYYRAEILDFTVEEMYVVRFVDYGNRESVGRDKLRHLPQKLMKKNSLARRCKLQLGRPDKGVEKLQEVLDGKELEVDFVTQQSPFEVIIYLEGQNVGKQMIDDKADLIIYASPDVSGNIQTGRVVSVDSCSRFYVTLDSWKDDEFLERVDNHYQQLGHSDEIFEKYTLDVKAENSKCVALIGEKWKRCQIKDFQYKFVQVLAVDTGEIEVVYGNNIRAMKEEFSFAPAQTVECYLDLAHYDVNMLEEFRRLVLDKELDIRFVSKESPFKIDLLVEGEDIVTRLAASMSLPDADQGLEVQYPEPKIKNSTGYISFAISPAKFFVQRTDQSDLLEQLSEKLNQTYAKVVKNSNNINVGSVCVAHSTEYEAWYRAIVTKIDGDHVNVQFIDYGNTEMKVKSDLKVLAPGFDSEPPFAIECSVPESEKVDVDKFLDMVIDKEYSFEFLTKDTAPYIVKLLENGQEVQLPACITPTSVNSFPALIAPQGQLKAFVSFAVSPSEFYLQLAQHEDNLNTLNDKMATLYEKEQPVVLSVEVGHICSAYSTEFEQWYRATIINTEGDQATVKFVDYGSSETKHKHELKVLDSSVSTQAPYAFQCTICGEAQSFHLAENDRFHELVIDKELSVDFVTTEEPFVVKLSENGSDISSQFIVTGTDGVADVPGEFPDLVLPEGEVEGYVSVVIGTTEFYVQRTDQQTLLDEINDRMANLYEGKTKLPLSKLEVGAVCAVLSTEYNGWYRARITCVENNQVTVQFVDYGNSEKKPTDDLRILDASLLKSPPLALPCTLCDGGQIPIQSKSEGFFDAVLSKENLKFVFSTKKIPFVTVVYENGTDVSSAFLMEGYKSSKIGYGYKIDGYVSHIETPESFYVQLASIEDDFYGLGDKLEAAVAKTPLDSLDICQPCVATHEETLSRCEVLKVNDGKITVRYVDTGNSATLDKSEIFALPESFLGNPRMGIHCTLQHVTKNKKWTDEEIESFKEIVLDKLLFIVTTSIKEPFVVTLKGEDVELDEFITSGVSGYSTLDLTLGTKFEVEITHHESPLEFCIQPTDHADGLDTLMGDLVAYEEEGALSSPTVDSPCVAPFEAELYRAEIVSLEGDCATVCFVDYGNHETVKLSELKPLKPEHMALPRLAVNCRLEGVSSELTDEMLNKFADLVEEKTLLCELVAKDNGVYSVRLLDMGIPIISKLSIGGNVEAAEEDSRHEIHGESSRSEDTEVEQETREVQVETEVLTFKPPKLNVGMRVNVCVTEVSDPNTLYCQDLKSSEDLPLLTDALHEYCEDGQMLETLVIDQACIAPYGDDGAWYRGLIEEEIDDQIRVRFVDYGNSESVTKTKLYKLLPEHVELPVQAFKCSLQVKPLGNEWDVASSTRFIELTSTEDVKMTLVIEGIRYGDNRQVSLVVGDLLIDEKSVSDTLIGGGYAKTSAEVKKEMVISIENSELDTKPTSDDEQYSSSREELDEFVDALVPQQAVSSENGFEKASVSNEETEAVGEHSTEGPEGVEDEAPEGTEDALLNAEDDIAEGKEDAENKTSEGTDDASSDAEDVAQAAEDAEYKCSDRLEDASSDAEDVAQAAEDAEDKCSEGSASSDAEDVAQAAEDAGDKCSEGSEDATSDAEDVAQAAEDAEDKCSEGSASSDAEDVAHAGGDAGDKCSEGSEDASSDAESVAEGAEDASSDAENVAEAAEDAEDKSSEGSEYASSDAEGSEDASSDAEDEVSEETEDVSLNAEDDVAEGEEDTRNEAPQETEDDTTGEISSEANEESDNDTAPEVVHESVMAGGDASAGRASTPSCVSSETGCNEADEQLDDLARKTVDGVVNLAVRQMDQMNQVTATNGDA